MILSTWPIQFKAEGEPLVCRRFGILRFCLLLAVSASLASAVTHSKRKGTRKAPARRTALRNPAIKNVAFAVPVKAVPVKTTSKKTTSGPWRAPNYADSTLGDWTEGDQPDVRRAAVEALGRLNGTVVVAEPSTGRILTIVNQKVAFKSGFQPCSTIKVPVALAALSETVVDRNTLIRIYGSTRIAMTEALAKSNNQYFASLGEKLGFDRVSYYAHLFGLGEKAGLDIDGE